MPGFLLLSSIWGGSFALIKIAVDAGVPPVWVAFWRCLFGAATLWAICAAQGITLPRDRKTWGHAAVVALLLNSVPFLLFAYRETRISSILAGVWNATVPLTTLVFVLGMVPQEHPTPRKLLGLATGFTGVLVVLGAWNGMDSTMLQGSLACLVATVCYGAALAYMRRHFTKGNPTANVTAQVTCAVAQLLPTTAMSPLTGMTTKAVIALILLGALGTGVAYILNFNVVRTRGSTIAATVTYVTPLWSTFFGFVFLGEPLGLNTAVGAALVIAGVTFTRTRSRARTQVTPPSPRPAPPHQGRRV